MLLVPPCWVPTSSQGPEPEDARSTANEVAAGGNVLGVHPTLNEALLTEAGTVTAVGGYGEVGTVTTKYVGYVELCPPTTTRTGPVVAPTGTDVAMLVAVEADTTAWMPLNVTTLLEGVVEKPVPVSVTG